MSKEELKNKRYYDEKQDLWVVSWNSVEKYLSQQAKELEEIKDTITIYLELQDKIFSSLTNLNDIEYSNYHKSYKKLKKLVGGK